MEILSDSDYYKIHTDFLIPLDLKVDVDLFKQEIAQYENNFIMWGDKFENWQRYGLPLVNDDGQINKETDPSCYPLDRWYFLQRGIEDTPEEYSKHIEQVIEGSIPFAKETDFTTKTEVLDISSLKQLKDTLGNYMTRSAILKWHTMSRFLPHIDSWSPFRWLRIWGTTDPDKMHVRYKVDDTSPGMFVYNGLTKQHEVYKNVEDIEAGRLYLIDTSQYHDAISMDNVYQFFISLNVDSYNTLKSLIIK